MDEIEAVATLRPQPPGPDPAATAAARARLHREIHPRPRLARRWRVVGAAAAMSLVLAAAVGLDRPSAPDPRPVAVTRLLDTAARGAATRAFTAPRDDQFAYRDQVVVDTDATGTHREQSRTWQSVGDPARVQTCSRKITEPASAFDCAQPPAAAPPRLDGGAAIDSYAYLESLPRDPGRLLDTLRAALPAGSAEPASVRLAGLLTDLLANPLSPPDLRAAALTAVARVPGVGIEEGVPDAAGRTGTAAAWTADGIRHQLVFRPDGSEYLGYRMVLARAGRYTDLAEVPAGTVVHSSALLGGGIVDRARQLPGNDTE